MELSDLRKWGLPALLIILLLLLNSFLAIIFVSPTIPQVASSAQSTEIRTIEGNFEGGIHQDGFLGLIIDKEDTYDLLVLDQEGGIQQNTSLRRTSLSPVVLTTQYTMALEAGYYQFTNSSLSYTKRIHVLSYNGSESILPVTISVPIEEDFTSADLDVPSNGELLGDQYLGSYILRIGTETDTYWLWGIFTIDLTILEVKTNNLGNSSRLISDIIIQPGDPYNLTTVERRSSGDLQYHYFGLNQQGQLEEQGATQLTCDQCQMHGMVGKEPFSIYWEEVYAGIAFNLQTTSTNRELTIERSGKVYLSTIQRVNDRYLAVHLEDYRDLAHYPEPQYYIIDIITNSSMIEIATNPAGYDDYHLSFVDGTDKLFYTITQKHGSQREFTIQAQQLDLPTILDEIKQKGWVAPVVLNTVGIGVLVLLVAAQLRSDNDEEESVLYPQE